MNLVVFFFFFFLVRGVGAKILVSPRMTGIQEPARVSEFTPDPSGFGAVCWLATSLPKAIQTTCLGRDKSENKSTRDLETPGCSDEALGLASLRA